MNTLILEKPGDLKLIDTAVPTEIPDGHALVRVHRVGVCGTDWHAYHGRQPFFSYPRILGHELGVEVIRVNDVTSNLKPADRCSVEPYLNCGKCIACRRGKGNCCINLRVMGVHSDGGMREQIVVPTRKLHPSKKLSFDQLALVETLGIGCHAVSRANPEAGENVLVIGAGPIGLSVIPFVQAVDANVIVADVSETRLAFCRDQMKVATTLDARGDVLKQVQEKLDGELPTVVIDATGNPGSMAKCFELIAQGGKIAFVGLFPGELSFNDPNFHKRECTLLASRNSLPGDFTRIIKLIEDGRVNTDPWITHRSSADHLMDVFPEWLKPESNVLKAMLEF